MEDTLDTKKRKLPENEEIEKKMRIHVISVNIQDQNQLYINTNKHEGFRYPFDQCVNTYSTVSYVKNHTRSRHEGIRYPCDQCEFAAITVHCTLIQHKDLNHGGVRYTCDQCKHSFTTQLDMRRHKQSLHVLIRYPCEQCKYAATSVTVLNKHMESRIVQDIICRK